MIDLILGGARSGKSRLAEQIAEKTGLEVIYIATAQAHDSEMQDRIEHHRQQRPSHWQVVEEPLYLSKIIQDYDQPHGVILVDCLTLWMSNLLLHEDPHFYEQEIEKLYTCLPKLKAHIILVSNETGLGVVPLGHLTRQFVDESGRLHQNLGKIAHRVQFCVAGFPIQLKGNESCNGG